MSAKLKKTLNRYFIDAMGAMALGLFASLLIGTIFGTIGEYLSSPSLTEMGGYAGKAFSFVGSAFIELAGFAKAASGMAIGVAIAHSLGAHPLVVYSCAVVGSVGYTLGASISDTVKYTAGPAGVFIAAIAAAEVGMLVSKKTKIDILVTPTVTLLTGYAVARIVCPAVAYIMYYLGSFINTATELHPFIMGVILSVVVGIILTLPISSAAICAMIGISGLAGGAAAVGCCAQMIGFAVISYRDNKVGGLIAQGLGTSMLQMGNIIKKPQIWIPPTLAAAVCGPLSTLLFKLKCTGVSAGMGTCGFVGVFGIIKDTEITAFSIIGIISTTILLPAVFSYIFYAIMRKLGFIKDGDMKLDL